MGYHVNMTHTTYDTAPLGDGTWRRRFVFRYRPLGEYAATSLAHWTFTKVEFFLVAHASILSCCLHAT